MPTIDAENKPTWAEQVELGDDEILPPPTEEYDDKNKLKIITEYKINDDGKKVKVVKTYKIETRRVSKSIALRKSWKKFGAASTDPPGPNPANTIIGEDVFMQFVHTKDQQNVPEQEDDAIAKLRASSKQVLCRICKGDHWTTRCPYKDTLEPIQDAISQDKGKVAAPAEPTAAGANASAASRPTKYVAPARREGGAASRGDSMPTKTRDDTATIRVTNLSEDTREGDLQDLFQAFGSISRIYLAKDKTTGQSKGFAFVNFHRKEDAARAIAGVSGFGYDHLILNVEWARPSGQN